MKKFGLIGFPLKHSFSKKYFTQKFMDLGIAETNCYEQYEMEFLDQNLIKTINQTENLVGLNVTIPHKRNVMPFLTEIDSAAQKIGAVNVIKISADKKYLKGYNSDYYGFKKSLENWLGDNKCKALILGNGGAAQAIKVALEDLKIDFKVVSRKTDNETISYAEANNLIASHHLIINCTPLGTFPDVNQCPNIDYTKLTPKHFLYDLVYNPELTKFLSHAKNCNANYKNGYEMLVFQAEKAWEIWNS